MDRMLRAFDRGRRARHLLHPGLGRRALPAAGAPDRGGRARAGQPRLRPSAGARADAGSSSARTCSRAKRCWRISAAWPSPATARRPSRSARATPGPSTCWRRPGTATAPASTRCGTTCTACRTRRASPYRPGAGALLEIPMTTVRARSAATCRSPAAAISGCCPTRCYRTALRRFQRRERAPGVFYFHPWEIDPGQPRMTAGAAASRGSATTVNLRAMAGAARPPAARLPLGPDGPRVRRRSRNGPGELSR